MNKNKIKCCALLLAIVSAIAWSVTIYAAKSFPVDYNPGTDDTVTNMPESDTGSAGGAYAVSATIPQREGYEFIGWTLDYGRAVNYTVYFREWNGDPAAELAETISEVGEIGDSQHLSAALINNYTVYGVQVNDGDVLVGGWETDLALTEDPSDNVVTFWYTHDTTNYTVYFREWNSDPVVELAGAVNKTGYIGASQHLGAAFIDNYTVYGVQVNDQDVQVGGWETDLTLAKDPGNNVVTFWYTRNPVALTVYYVDKDTGERLTFDYNGTTVDHDTGEGGIGDVVNLSPRRFDNYLFCSSQVAGEQEQANKGDVALTLSGDEDNNVVTFYYVRTASVTILHLWHGADPYNYTNEDVIYPAEVEDNLRVGSRYTTNAITWNPIWIPVGKTTDTITIESDSSKNLIVFYYEPDGLE